MVLATLPNLYTAPSDVADYLGVENVDLRLDDQQLASGQTITCTADAAAGATSINVTAVRAPLLKGAQLSFYGAGTGSVIVAALTAVANVGDTTLSVSALPLLINADATATDSGVNIATAARLAKGCRYGTAEVQLWCLCRYDDSQLAQSWSVNKWATAIAARWVCKRRGQSAPSGVEDDFKEAMERLKMVQSGKLNIESLGTRTAGWPFIVNQTIDVRYDIVKMRVEPVISEGTPTQFTEFLDWDSVFNIGLY